MGVRSLRPTGTWGSVLGLATGDGRTVDGRVRVKPGQKVEGRPVKTVVLVDGPPNGEATPTGSGVHVESTSGRSSVPVEADRTGSGEVWKVHGTRTFPLHPHTDREGDAR